MHCLKQVTTKEEVDSAMLGFLQCILPYDVICYCSYFGNFPSSAHGADQATLVDRHPDRIILKQFLFMKPSYTG